MKNKKLSRYLLLGLIIVGFSPEIKAGQDLKSKFIVISFENTVGGVTLLPNFGTYKTFSEFRVEKFNGEMVQRLDVMLKEPLTSGKRKLEVSRGLLLYQDEIIINTLNMAAIHISSIPNIRKAETKVLSCPAVSLIYVDSPGEFIPLTFTITGTADNPKCVVRSGQ